ncbi:MAG: type II toxin-antitoxin system VapC family toxin [Acidobacteriota bacterium]
MVIVDASVLVAALVDSGESGRWAEEIVLGEELITPHLAPVEAANVLRRLESSGRVTSADADRARRHLLRLDLNLFPFEPFADRIWELRHNLTSYDAWYVALAEGLDLALATLDRALAEASGPRCSFVLP